MQRKTDYLLPFLFALFLAIGMVLGGKFNPSSETFGGDDYGKKLNQVLGYIESSYVDTPNKQALVENAIVKMLEELDPYSSYVSADDLLNANEQLEGNFEGIGVEFNVINDTVTVLHVIPSGPSQRVGILPGDQIVNVEGETIAGVSITNSDIIKKLKGPKGTKVDVGIKRRHEPELVNFSITRDKIKIESVVAAFMLNATTGYIKVERFAGNTSADFIANIDKLKTAGANTLIVDLRGNPGGYLGAATSMVDQFLNEGNLITYTYGRSRKRDDYLATSDGVFKQGNVVVLINEGSASASEIFAGAIQDLDRGLIIGHRSHGKGLVQEPINLRDGSQIRLTVARYYTPSGRCIQRPYDMSIVNGANDSIAKTFKTKKGRSVKEGGGIIPDIIVSQDSMVKNEFYASTYRKGFLYELALDYYNSNLDRLTNEFKDVETFDKNFNISESIIDSCKNKLNKYKIEYALPIPEDVKLAINIHFKALIARYMWGDFAFYLIMNKSDNYIKSALDAIDNNKFATYGVSSNKG